MGRTYLFECAKCGYKAHVSGAADHGRDFSVQTIVCLDCKKLYDAVVRLRVLQERPDEPGRLGLLRLSPKAALRRPAPNPPDFARALNRLPLPADKRFRWARFKPGCPAFPFHKVEVWRDPGHCPRCGSFLERGPLPFRAWD